jgi:hypothetical protein
MAINRTNFVEDFIKGYSSCEDLETALNNVNRKLADQYNLSDSQIKAYERQKVTLESKINNSKCAEQKQQAMAQNLEKLSKELSAVEAQKKAEQQKMLKYGLVGVGGLVVIVVLYQFLKK